MQTIAAISTPAGAGAIAIIRMSGDDALAIAARLFSCKELGDFSQAEPRKMYLGTINAGEYADRCLAVRFKAPKTYTGEEIVEFHCHGGARLAREVLAACVACGARVADKGEFTKRAFLAGKLALSDAEAVIDMINAESGAALKASYRMLTGALADEIKAFSDRLLDACASLEASFDYPEEMEDESVFDAKGAVADALEHVEKLLAEIQENIYRKALAFRDSMITKVDSYEEFKDLLEKKGGFFLCHWDETPETEEKIKADTKATIRCIPFDSPEEEGKDMITGRPSHRRVLIAKAY